MWKPKDVIRISATDRKAVKGSLRPDSENMMAP